MSLECRSADLCFLRLKTVDLIMGGSGAAAQGFFAGPSSCECKIKEDGEEYFYEEFGGLK